MTGTARIARGGAMVGVLLAAALAVLRGPGPEALGALYVAAVSVPLAVIDAREHRLPNALVLPGFGFLAVGVLWAWLARGSPPWIAVVAVVATIALLGMFGVGGGIGMGDVKLSALLAGVLAAIAAERGPPEAAGGCAVFLAASFVTAGLAGAAEARAGRRAGAEIALGPILLGAFWPVAALW